MSRVDIKLQMKLLKEAQKYLKDVKQASGVVLTQEHISEWLQVFYDDLIMLDGCNHAKVKY